ncbi:MAG: TolB family protein, partial [Syntrophothermus sp.]
VSRAETLTLHAKVPRVPVLLHTKSTNSNGLTVWAPRRIELYPNPPQDLYAEDWLEQLAIHEYRHTVQISKMNQGFTRVLYFLFGEQITGGILGLYVPSWFLEGDATVTETALSNSGRGRTPTFENILRAQLLEKGIYAYDKAVLGSYKTFTPNQYELGYPLVAQVRKQYGTKVWNSALNRTARMPFMVVPFSSGIKKETGLTKVKLYRKSLEELRKDWQHQEDAEKYSDIRYITARNPRNYTHYVHPVFQNDTIIATEKETNEDVDWMVSVNRITGEEKKLVAKGYGYDESLSISGNLLTWSEWQPHPRWRNKDYSVIRVYDFKKNKAFFLTHRTRYFAPAFSPEGKKISAIRTDDEYNCYIDILDVSNGKVLQIFKIPQNNYAETPVWAPDGNHLIFTLVTEKGKTISEIDLSSGKIKNLLPFSFREMSGPAYYRDHFIVYAADYSGLQDMYVLDTLSHKIFRIISSKFFTSDPDFTGDRSLMTFLDYTSDGSMIAEMPMDTNKWVPVENITNHSIRLYEAIADQEKFNVQDSSLNRKLYLMLSGNDSIHGKTYPVKRYSKWLTLFNPHSWAPASLDAGNLTVKPGVSINSQNILNTSFTTLGYEYDLNEEAGKYYARYSYQGFYPELNFYFDYGDRAGQYRPAHSSELRRYTFREMNFQFNTAVPLNLSRGRHIRLVQPSAGLTYLEQKPGPKTPGGFISKYYQTIDYRLYLSDFIISNHQDMYPAWGQTLDVRFRNTPFESARYASVLSAEGNLYLRGFFRHHGFWFYAGIQQEKKRSLYGYDFPDYVAYPRGISGKDNKELRSLQVNYKLPLINPDLSIGSVLYIKRIKLNLFADYAEEKEDTRWNYYRSTGAELTFDLHILRFIYPFELGVRSIYFPDDKTVAFEFLYSINF